jgi:hypothetical protein
VPGGLNYIEVRKIVYECIKQIGVSYEELYITPISNGFKVELSPTPRINELEEVSKCISAKTKLDTCVKEYPYGNIIVARTRKTT